jgi:FdhE protein
MPLVRPAPANRKTRLEIAESRWADLHTRRPDLAPAIALQRELVGLVVDLTDTVEQARPPRLSLPPKYVAAKLSRGVPILAGEPIPVPTAVLKPTLLALCDALARGGAGDPAEHIRSLIANGRLEAGSLFAASIARDQKSIRNGATYRGLSPDLLWLVGELAVSPFVHVLIQTVTGSGDTTLDAALGGWDRGYCPACGSWPALAEVAESHRVLRCSFCATAWEMNRYACVYCDEAGEAFVTAAPDPERLDRRLELCNSCGGYLKTVDVAALSPFPLLAIADMETMDLDLAAMERNYRRPNGKEFATKK